MYYHHYMTTVFENVDEIVEIELTIPSLKCIKKSKDSEILGTVENKNTSFRTTVNSQIPIFYQMSCLGPSSKANSA